jgi:hypothetical protein
MLHVFARRELRPKFDRVIIRCRPERRICTQRRRKQNLTTCRHPVDASHITAIHLKVIQNLEYTILYHHAILIQSRCSQKIVIAILTKYQQSCVNADTQAPLGCVVYVPAKINMLSLANAADGTPAH